MPTSIIPAGGVPQPWNASGMAVRGGGLMTLSLAGLNAPTLMSPWGQDAPTVSHPDATPDISGGAGNITLNVDGVWVVHFDCTWDGRAPNPGAWTTMRAQLFSGGLGTGLDVHQSIFTNVGQMNMGATWILDPAQGIGSAGDVLDMRFMYDFSFSGFTGVFPAIDITQANFWVARIGD